VVDVTAATCHHPLPSAELLGTRQSIFIFLNFFAGCPMTWHPAKASLPGAQGGTRQIFLFFLPHFFVGPCYSK
jgi:hypothetical protein